jgi:RNA polymerase sigma factor (sigma-70 family)
MAKEKKMVNNLIGSFSKKVEMYNLSEQNKLIVSCLPMMHALSIRIARKTGCSHEDLFQESVLGLLRAAQAYNGKNGAKFSTYAYFWAMAFISNYINKEYKLNKIIYQDDKNDCLKNPENILLEKEKKKILKLSLLDLTPMQLKIIGLRFFTDEKQNKSLNSLANELCLEKSKLIRIYKMALLELREKCKDY